MYIIGITGTLLIVLEQFLMHRFHFGNDAYTMQEIKVRFRDSLEFRDYLFLPSTRAGRQYLQLRREQDGRWRCGLYLDRPGQGTHQRPGAAGADGPA